MAHGEGTHYSRKRSFLSPRGHEEKGRVLLERREEDATRGKTEEGEDYVTPLAGRGRGNRSLLPLGKRRERRREEEGVVRDPPAKGSYYNKFVGDLRSGNNSELRVTLRMCLSLLLFKWEWKATSCAGCDLHLSLFPPLLLYFLSSPARGPGNMEKPFRKAGREPFWKGGEVD